MTIADILVALEAIAPAHLAFEWDRIGLQVGSHQTSVKQGVTCLDLTPDKAKALAPGTIVIGHHPIIWDPLKVVRTDFFEGSVIAELLRNDCGFIAAHTNWDAADGGINDTLAGRLGLLDLKPCGIAAHADGPSMGRVGTLSEEMSLADFRDMVDERLGSRSQVTGRPDLPVRRVALTGGAAGEDWIAAKRTGANVFLSGEIRHHELIGASFAGLATIEAGHYATEHPGMEALRDRLAMALPKLEWACLANEPGEFGSSW